MRTLTLLCAVCTVLVSGCGGSDSNTRPISPEEKAKIDEARRVMRGETKVEQTRALIVELARGVDLFRYDNNRYPKDLGELQNRPADVAREAWRGPYFTGSINDSWDNPVTYRLPGVGDHAYDLVSWGEDGKEGGEGFGGDMTNHD